MTNMKRILHIHTLDRIQDQVLLAIIPLSSWESYFLFAYFYCLDYLMENPADIVAITIILDIIITTITILTGTQTAGIIQIVGIAGDQIVGTQIAGIQAIQIGIQTGDSWIYKEDYFCQVRRQ